MKYINFLLYTIITFTHATTNCYLEITTLADIKNYINPQEKTVILFDIDNTLAMPKNELGSDEWFVHQIQKRTKKGYDITHAMYLTLPTYFFIQFNIMLIPTETIVAPLLRSFCKQGIYTLGLTARSLYIADRTIQQLQHINIQFNPPQPNLSDMFLPLETPAIYKSGILFSGSNNKGHVVRYFLHEINFIPDHIIFIDDKEKNISMVVESYYNNPHTKCTGIRYAGCDEKVAAFDPKKAQHQMDMLLAQCIYEVNYLAS